MNGQRQSHTDVEHENPTAGNTAVATTILPIRIRSGKNEAGALKHAQRGLTASKAQVGVTPHEFMTK